MRVDFLRRDARDFSFKEPFDLVMMICEGAFALMETDGMNFAILRNAAGALVGGGKLVLTTLNALYPLFHSVKDFLNAGKSPAEMEMHELTFDLISFRERATARFVDDHGREKLIQTNERYYDPSEMSWLLTQLIFHQVDILGCELGASSRARGLSPDDFVPRPLPGSALTL